ncbi:NAD(P)/FAD-dependent oxidoreductase [Haliovirga abyssi]|uniref:FAD-dependent oxidoreductase n=1 Tax=Haliovirga abyssi TaxID=2996794 RepID=A0AAU9DE91_9FUSO|nr:NAD(P)/FAD-dependent oxidoreductase [Haliovirga abyssi]BDU50513.1 FAD-dependent oxidoreductase [Haliovirga abyssi]
MEKYDVIIIGGGPAGLFTAINIKKEMSVLILEKNQKVGKKLLMAGAGRCNITHEGEMSEFFNHYGNNYKFLKTVFKEFSNKDMINFFKRRGMGIIVDKNGKIFPETEKSKDILKILINECMKKGVVIKNNETVLKAEEIKEEDKKIDEKFIIKTKNNIYMCDKLVISTGGKSYPTSGSSGDGYIFAKNLGHKIVSLKPALAPAFITDYKFKNISGVSLKNIKIYLYRENKKIGEHIGDIGFTHVGLSGPGILDFSRDIKEDDVLKVNFIGEKIDKFKKEFIKETEKDGNVIIKNYLKRYKIPESLIKSVLEQINMDILTKMAEISKDKRNKLAKMFCEYPFEIDRMGDYNIAMATTGGVALKEINGKTMESKIVKNLFFAGEVVDIDGDTGGYNIQAAFSMGYTVAKSINGGL